jgi:hypothetical protein
VVRGGECWGVGGGCLIACECPWREREEGIWEMGKRA